MKKLVILLVASVIAIFVCMVYAAPGDVNITFTIPANQVVEFRAAFLAYMPNNQMIDDPENPGELIKEFTDKQWFKEKLRKHLNQILDRGNDIRNDQAPVYVTDPNAFTVTVE